MIRPAVPADVPALVQLVRDLAEYERAPEAAVATEAQLHDVLFGPQAAVFCDVADVEGEVVGMAVWFLSFSTWLGLHGIDFLLARLRNDRDGGVANSGMQAFGLLFKTLALLVVLFAALSKSQDVALTAALTYGLAYTFELGLSISSYFGSPVRKGAVR